MQPVIQSRPARSQTTCSVGHVRYGHVVRRVTRATRSLDADEMKLSNVRGDRRGDGSSLFVGIFYGGRRVDFASSALLERRNIISMFLFRSKMKQNGYGRREVDPFRLGN